MHKGIGKVLLCAAMLLALGAIASQSAFAACGCNKCSAKKSCGCKKQKCGCKQKDCGCGPALWSADPGIGGYSLDLSCADSCCFKAPCEQEVCIDGWNLCDKWCDGRIHHPYELTYNGHGMLCDTSCCSAYIPLKRRGTICRTECKERRDGCGCASCCAETTCEEVTRPRTIPWWFNPGHGNTYLDADGQPVCGQT
nr:hypothetical protein [bacterium]